MRSTDMFRQIAIMITLSMILICASLRITITSRIIMRDFYEEDLLIVLEAMYTTVANLNTLKKLLLCPSFDFRYYYNKISLNLEKTIRISGLAQPNDLRLFLPIELLQKSADTKQWLFDNLDKLGSVPLCTDGLNLAGSQAHEQIKLLNHILMHQASNYVSGSWGSQINDYKILLDGDLWRLFDVHIYTSSIDRRPKDMRLVLNHIIGLAKNGNVLAQLRIAMIIAIDYDYVTDVAIDLGNTLESDNKKFAEALRAISTGEKKSHKTEIFNSVKLALEAQSIEKTVRVAFLFESITFIMWRFGPFSTKLKRLIKGLLNDYGPDVVSPYSLKVLTSRIHDPVPNTLNSQWKSFVEQEWFYSSLPSQFLDSNKATNLWMLRNLRLGSRDRGYSYRH